MKKLCTCLFFACSFVIFVIHSGNAGQRYVVAAGNWNQTSIWSAIPGGSPGAPVPTSADTVYLANGMPDFFFPTIPSAHNAVCKRLEFGLPTTSIGSALMFSSSGSTLTVGGDLIVYGPNGPADRLIYVNSGRLTVMGNLELGTGQTSTADDRICRLTTSTGTVTISGNLIFNNVPGSSPLQTRIDMRAGAGTVNLAGTFIINNNTGMVNGGSESLFNFDGTSPQTISLKVGAVIFNTLVINNTSSSGAVLSGPITTANVTGSVIVQGGMLDNGGFSIQGNTGADFEVADSATFRMTGTSGMVTGFATKTFGAASTVNYAGADQQISAQTYGNLVLSGTGNKVLSGSPTTVAGNLSLLGTATASAGANLTVNGSFTIGPTAAFHAGGFTHTLLGNFVNNGTLVPETSTFMFNGSGAQSVSGATSFNNVIFNNAAGITLQSDITANGALTLTTGNVTTGPNVLTVGTSASSLGSLTRTSGTVIGNFRQWCAAATTSNILFPVGTSSNYRPANISFTTAPSAGGTLTATFLNSSPGTLGLPITDGGTEVKTCSGEGFWRLTAGSGLGGGTYSLDLTADGFSGVSDFTTLRILKRSDGSAPWTLNGTHVTGTGSNTSPVVHRAGMSGFSEFGIGAGSENPLPIQLQRFTATVLGHGVRLEWQTLTETKNYGFELQKSQHASTDYQTIPNSLVLGHGTTLSPQTYSYTDEGTVSGTWYYRLRQIDLDGTIHVSSPILIDLAADMTHDPAPTEFALRQNFPNPANPTTAISYQLPAVSFVTLKVYDMLGQEVSVLVNEQQTPGRYEVRFDASRLASGTYLYRLSAGSFAETKKLTLVK